MLKKKGYIIWPIYFDASVSRSLCRRVPLSLSMRNPKAEQIVEAARRLGWSAVIEPGGHPALWWRKTGKVIVNPGKPMKKSEVIRALAKAMKSGERSGLSALPPSSHWEAFGGNAGSPHPSGADNQKRF